MRKGRLTGGVPLNKANLNYILRNNLYIGKIRHKSETYKGVHDPIIPEDMFNQAQQIFSKNRREKQKQWEKSGGGLLSKIFRCEHCDAAMVYSYAYKKNYKYLYYMCHKVTKTGFESCPTKTIAAQNCENTMLDCLQKICDDPRLEAKAWAALSTGQQREIIRSLVQDIYYDAVDPTIKIRLINDPKRHEFKIDLKQNRVYRPRENSKPQKQPHIRLLLLLAHQIQAMLKEDKTKDLKTIANWLNMNYSRICQIMNLLLLAPKIQEEIICSNDERLFEIPEYKLREILDELNWSNQLKSWQNLLRQYPTASISVSN